MQRAKEQKRIVIFSHPMADCPLKIFGFAKARSNPNKLKGKTHSQTLRGDDIAVDKTPSPVRTVSGIRLNNLDDGWFSVRCLSDCEYTPAHLHK